MGNDKKRAGWKDRQIGANLRRLRAAAGLSQVEAARWLGITYQQIQKYERGGSRLSASALHELAIFYQTSYASFFEGLDEAPPAETPPPDTAVLKILALVSGIEDAGLKRKIGKIVAILAE